MKVSTNTELVKSRSKWAKRVAPLTMFLLIGGLVTNFLSLSNPSYFQPTLILLGLGFVSAIISSHLVNNWVREPRADQTLSQLLKKFGNDYMLFNYTTVVPHALIAPDGVYAIVVKNHDGEITVEGSRFKRKFRWQRLLKIFADEGLGAPAREAESKSNKLAKYLADNLEDEEIPPVKPLILFANRDVNLTVHEPEIPVLPATDFKLYLREESKNRLLTTDQRKKIATLLEQ